MTDQLAIPAIERAAKDVNQNFENNSIQLKKAARKFLKGVRKLIFDYQRIKVLTKSTKNGIGTSLSEIYKVMHENTKITQECIKLQYNFQNALNKFLGRQILLLYVTQDGKMLYADQLNAAKIYQSASAKSDGKGSIKNLDITKLKKYPDEISEEYKSIIQRRENLYRPIQKEVIKRWTDNHNPNNVWVKGNPKLQNTFYWLVGIENGKNKWNWSKRINRGHIYETYAHLVWEEENLMILNPTVESDIGFYWDYMVSHGLLNSISGIVKGDVSFFLNPSIQFAVKSGSFNTAAMGSYLDVAYQLSYGSIEIKRETVELLLNNLPSYSYQVRNYGLRKAEEKIFESIKKTSQ